MEIVQNTTYYLEILITDKNGNPVTGLTCTYQIYKSSDNSLVNNGSLIDIGNGVYQASYTFNNLGQYRAIYTTPNKYSNEIETILVVTSQITSDKIDRILGLSQENFRLINPVYDRRNNLISGKIKLYRSASDCENDVNAFAEYDIDATHNNKNIMTDYQSKRTI